MAASAPPVFFNANMFKISSHGVGQTIKKNVLANEGLEA